MLKTDSILEQNPVEAPLYTFSDAVHYLRVPEFALFALLGRGHFDREDFFHCCRCFRPSSPISWDQDIFSFRDDVPDKISFLTLTRLFVYSFLFRAPHNLERFNHWNSSEITHLFEALRDAWRAQPSFDDPDPNRILKQFQSYATRLTHLGQEDLRKLIVLHLERVEFEDRLPLRFYPFSRDPEPDAPRFVVIDPKLRFGRPIVKGAPTDVLAERWRAGDSAQILAEDYGLTTDEVDEALRYETVPYPRAFPFP